MGKKNVNLKYDPDTDILHVSIGKAQKALSVEKEPEVFVRIHPKTQEIVGFTFLGFKQDFLSHKQDITFSPGLSA